MRIIVFITLLIFLALFIYFGTRNKNKSKVYPDYYKEVWIMYKYPKESTKLEQAWLTVNDYGDYIWTLSSDDTTIVQDKYVINWYS